jgi:hypothetical protein
VWGRFWPPVSNALFAISGMTQSAGQETGSLFSETGSQFGRIPEGMQLKGSGFAKDSELRQSEQAIRYLSRHKRTPIVCPAIARQYRWRLPISVS